jgi:hypothetical protein
MKRAGILIVVVVALVAATMAGLWWGSHTTHTATSTTPTPTTNATSTASEIAVGNVAAGEGGSLPGPGTLKLGYAHTQDGAVAALTNYILAAEDKVNLAEPAYRAALVNAIAFDDNSKADLTSGVEGGAKICARYGVCKWDPRRGAYAVRSYSDDQAEIAVWAPFVWAEPTDPSGKASIAWGIEKHLVFWNGTDWKIKTLGQDGVTDDSTIALQVPADPQGNPSSAEKSAILTTPRDGAVKLWTLSWKEYANAIH